MKVKEGKVSIMHLTILTCLNNEKNKQTQNKEKRKNNT